MEEKQKQGKYANGLKIKKKTESSCFRVTFAQFYLNKMNLTV